MKKRLTACVLICCGTVFAGEILTDSFQGENGIGLNDRLEKRQDGTAAPVRYSVHTFKAKESVGLQDGAAHLNLDGTGFVRIVPDLNLATEQDGHGFEVSFVAHAGLNYEGNIHGSYLTTVVFGQRSVIESSAGAGNPHVALGISLAGNGRVNVFAAGQKLFWQQEALSLLPRYENTIRIAVSTDGFSRGDKAEFVMYLNDVEVCRGDFEWVASQDLRLGLQADSWSARFKNLILSD